MVAIRDAMLGDARAIAGVLVGSWRVAYSGLMPDEVLAGLSVAEREGFWSDVLTARPPRSSAVVATIAGDVVGFAAADPPLVAEDREDPTLGDLYALYLAPDAWRRGIGTRLHAAALERLRVCGFTHAGLWVLDTNERALRFYYRQGWTDTGRSRLDRGPGGVELAIPRRPSRATRQSPPARDLPKRIFPVETCMQASPMRGPGLHVFQP